MCLNVKTSLLTYYIFALIVICIAMYMFLYIDAQVYHHPNNDNIKKSYEKVKVEPELSKTNQINANITIDTEDANDDVTRPLSLGKFKLTAYCPCEICCGEWAYNRTNGIVYGAIGEELTEGYSIAVDPTVIPYRTEVIINGKTYKAQDCGGAIKGNRIDVYFEDHNEALEFGVQHMEVFLVK